MESAVLLPELVSLICQHVYADSLEHVLDPPAVTRTSRRSGVATLYALCLVSKCFNVEATPWLYRHVSLSMPASFESLVGTIGVVEADSDAQDAQQDSTDVRLGRLMLGDKREASLEHGLLTPPSSRETSLERDGPRGRTRSITSTDSSFFLPVSPLEATSRHLTPQSASPWREDNPGLWTKTITFERFRSHGLRRTVRESSRQRFVTCARLLHILRGTRASGNLCESPYSLENSLQDNGFHSITKSGNLEAVGLTEYIDSALTLEVLDELLLRGGHATGVQPHPIQGSALARITTPIKALDLCGCVSRTFIEALSQLIAKYRLNATHPAADTIVFPHLQRLGLFNVLVGANILTHLVMAFPNLTHLDLGGTRATPALLAALGSSTTVKLQSLSLARCQMLDSQSIRDFLVNSTSVLASLIELNMYYEPTSASPLTREHLQSVLRESVVFGSAKLRYLDLSTAPLDDELLQEMPQLPHLVDLGLSQCPHISFRGLQRFIEEKAPAVEVLSIRGSCRQNMMPVQPGRTSRRNDALLNTIMGVHQCLLPPKGRRSHSKLRVIELDEKALEAIDEAGPHDDWRIFFGKGWRGWYVDCGAPRAGLASEAAGIEAHRTRMIQLAKQSKKGGDFGWHARKMAILSPDGLLGREHGLYNFHSFS